MSKKTQKPDQSGFEPTLVALSVAAISAVTLVLFALIGSSSL